MPIRIVSRHHQGPPGPTLLDGRYVPFGCFGYFKRQLLIRTHVAVTGRYHQTPYAVWDLSFSRPTGHVQPYLQLTNLSNTGYQEIVGVPMPPRALTGGVEIVLTKGVR